MEGGGNGGMDSRFSRSLHDLGRGNNSGELKGWSREVNGFWEFHD